MHGNVILGYARLTCRLERTNRKIAAGFEQVVWGGGRACGLLTGGQLGWKDGSQN